MRAAVPSARDLPDPASDMPNLLYLAFDCARPRERPVGVMLDDYDEVVVRPAPGREISRGSPGRRRLSIGLPEADVPPEGHLLVRRGGRWLAPPRIKFGAI